MGASWAWCKSYRKFSLYLYCILHSAYTIIASGLFIDVSSIYYASENAFFMSYFMYLCLRPEISTAKTINTDNIILAFYKGTKGSLLMNIGSLFGLDVKSMCLIAGDNCLRLKKNKKVFVVTTNVKGILEDDNYLKIDTGVPVTKKFITQLRDYANVKAGVGIFRCRCIEAVHNLLGLIGEEWRPKNKLEWIPSVYLKRCLNIRN